MLPYAAPLTRLSLFLQLHQLTLRLYISSQLVSREAGLRSDWSLSEGAVFPPDHTHLTSLTVLPGPTSNVVPHVDSQPSAIKYMTESDFLHGGKKTFTRGKTVKTRILLKSKVSEGEVLLIEMCT